MVDATGMHIIYRHSSKCHTLQLQFVTISTNQQFILVLAEITMCVELKALSLKIEDLLLLLLQPFYDSLSGTTQVIR